MDVVNVSLYQLENQLAVIVNGLEATPLNWCRGSIDKLAALMRTFHAAVDNIQADPRLAGHAIENDTLKAMETARNFYAALASKFEVNYREALAEALPYLDPANVQEAINYQVAAVRIWARCQAEFSGGQSIENVIARADRVNIQVLREELPAYLRSTVMAGAVDYGQVYQGYEHLLDARELELMTPRERAAHTAKHELETGRMNFQTALSYANSELDESLAQYGASRWTVLPGWKKGSVIQV